MTPSISVVIPCHNQGAFLADAIRSVLAQSIPPTEVVVVDDGSTDGSLDVARRFGSEVAILSRSRGGAAAARNCGVAHARSEAIAFLDADDLWPSRSLECRLDALLSARADLAYGVVEERRADRPEWPGRRAPARMAGSMLIRRSAFDRVGPFDETLRSAEVIDWCTRADEVGLVRFAVEDVVLIRRIHGGNMMLQARDGDLQRLRVLRAAVHRQRAGRGGAA